MSESPQDKIRILYVDDEENNLQAFRATFRKIYDIYLAPSAKEAREILHHHDVHIIITDQRMPEETGVDLLASIILTNPEPIRILLTGYTDIQAVIDAINKGQIYHYLTKPWEEEYMKNVISNAYELYSLRRANKELTEELKQRNIELQSMLNLRELP